MTTLSRFVPEGTSYFYGYPAGEDSHFFNLVPPSIEELVSARPLVCAGAHTNVVTFQNSARGEILSLLRDMGVPQIGESQIIRLDEDISADIVGAERNNRIIASLRERVPAGSLIMAQPYERPELQDTYQLKPDISVALNDKRNMRSYIPEQYLPALLASYNSGAELSGDVRNLAPCVVKVTSSSSGDGVRVCVTPAEFEEAQKEFVGVHTCIEVHQYVDARENIGIQFGIPSDTSKPAEILGLSRQVTSKKGEFMGGIVLQNDTVSDRISDILLKDVLPVVRQKGWYGVGGLDVLLDSNDGIYFIDPNFRITAMSAYVYQAVDGVVGKNMLTMTARFGGSEKELKHLAESNGRSQLFNLIAARRDAQGFQFNGALLFDGKETLRENAKRAIDEGVQAPVLSAVVNNDSEITIPVLP